MTITLAFYKGTLAENPHARVFDRLVCWWPRSCGRFSHAELADVSAGAASAWCWSSSMLDGGVRGKWIDLTTGRWVLVLLPEAYDLQAAEQFIRARVGQPYDYPGILGFVVPLVKELCGWWYCSEIVAAALRAIARALGLPMPPTSNMSPSALFKWAAAQPGAVVQEHPGVVG